MPCSVWDQSRVTDRVKTAQLLESLKAAADNW